MGSLIARGTLERSRFFLAQAEAIGRDDRSAFSHYLDAAIVFARSVTFHLQAELKHQEGFDPWYLTWQKALGADPICKFFVEKRNFALKEGPVTVRGHITVVISEGLEMRVSMGMVVVRVGPWYRRPLRTLVQDATRPIVRGIASVRERMRAWRRARQQLVATEVRHAIYFDENPWRDRPATDLALHYLAQLERVVTDAELRFRAALEGQESAG